HLWIATFPSKDFRIHLVYHWSSFREDAARNTLSLLSIETNYYSVDPNSKSDIPGQIRLQLSEVPFFLFQFMQRATQTLSRFRGQGANEAGHLRIHLDLNLHPVKKAAGTGLCRICLFESRA